MSAIQRFLIHQKDGVRRSINPTEVYFLEAGQGDTIFRLPKQKLLRDVRRLGTVIQRLLPYGFIRIHKQYAVNLAFVQTIRKRSDSVDWELKLEAPLNTVLPVSRNYIKDVWIAFGDKDEE